MFESWWDPPTRVADDGLSSELSARFCETELGEPFAQGDRARLVRDLARNSGYQREPLRHVFPGQSAFLLVTAFPALRSQRRVQEAKPGLQNHPILPVNVCVEAALRRYLSR